VGRPGSHPGSARGFSQPLSGLLADPSSTALFRAATTPDHKSSGRSPRPGRGPLSGSTSSLAVVHQRALTRRPGLIACGFPNAHATRTQLPRSATDYGFSFHERGARFPIALGQDRRNRHVSPARSTSKPSSRFESVRAVPSCPGPAAVTLLTFCPSRVCPQTSEPRTRPASRTGHRLLPLGSSPADLSEDYGDQQPPRSGGISTPGEPNAFLPRQYPTPLDAGPRHLSVTTPSPLPFD
jgi:hypothetical protein